jgi:thioredoxin-like negative regulator of GroEL
MPSFYVDDVDIDVDEFLSACSDSERKELIDALVEDGYIKRENVLTQGKHAAVNEFDNACNHMIGNSWRLSKEDEEIITNISKKIIS